MRSYTKLLLVGLLAALALSMVTGTAAANRSLSLNNGGQRTFSYSGMYTFTDGVNFSVICRVLRIITMHRDAIPKVIGTLIGTATVEARECSGGTVVVLERTTWNIRFMGFTGTLPAIRTVRLEIDPGARGGFLLSVFFGIARCLYGGRVAGIATVNAAGEITEIRAEERPNAATVNLGGVECPEGILRGILRILNISPLIKLRLV